MITIKTAEDFAKMRHAGRVVARILGELREAAAPGTTLLDLDRIAARIIREGDCTPNFLNYHGFPANTCLSVNDELVHGIPSERALKDGDILSVDAGAIHQGWHADAAITFPIGEVPADTLKLIETTERALEVGIALTTVGARLGDLGHAIGAVAEGQGYGVVREYTGHGIGLQMHEDPQVPNYGRPGKGMKLREDMAICIEPMFNAGSRETRVLDDGWTVVTADGSLCAHFEHTIAITPDGPQVLTLP
uniref:Methionine aminopeptidase n=1 Tax=uncultured actinobacterium Rifle_16ft_4_minimus_9892 TaxID=1665150 RepID=A0A0H4TVV3_9ACTN|nr:methionine aminopeptidase, methionyl aminopeptidase [uncultured actinobacterium Rifle_16ft_4_minimus_9892]